MADESVKHARGFEPPPWEAEQFEALARKRAAEEEMQRRLTEASAAAAQQAAAAPVAAEAATPTGAPPAPKPSAGAAPDRPAPAGRGEGSPDAAEADVMLLSLRAEEPEALKGAWIVPMVAGGPILVMGLAMAVMGALSMAGAKQNPTQQGLVSGVLIAGALCLLALGGWLVAKSLKTRSIGG